MTRRPCRFPPVINKYSLIFVVGLGAETTEPSGLEHITVMGVEVVQEREEGATGLATCGEPIEEFSVHFGRVFAVASERFVDGFHGVKPADGLENVLGEVDRDLVVFDARLTMTQVFRALRLGNI